MSRSADAVLRPAEAARKAARTGFVLAAALLAPLAAGVARAAPKSSLEVDVSLQGFALIKDATASQGAVPGSINLNWTEPARAGATAPFTYDIRASSLAQISDGVDFATSPALSVFSPSAIPSPGPGGGAGAMTVTGLVPGVTYYFAIREADSASRAGMWARSVPKGWNVANLSAARFNPGPPNAVADLVVVASGTLAAPIAHMTWTAPSNANGVPIAGYTIKYSTVGAAAFGSGAAWFANAPSTSVAVSSARAPGLGEAVDVAGLPPNQTVYFGVKSVDVQGEVSPVDAQAASVSGQARLGAALIDLSAAPGAGSGSIALSWVEPSLPNPTAPLSYAIRASTIANFSDNAGFGAAQPLAVFSTSTPPSPGAGGALVTFVVTGLVPKTTYYFGIRETDSAAVANQTSWVRDPSISTVNFAAATFAANAPDAVADLRGSSTAAEGELLVSWTATRNQNFAPMASYVVKYASFSAASLGGDATAWFNLAPSSAVAAALPAGSTITLTLEGLYPLATFYFAVRGVDVFGELSPVDSRATGGAQAFSMPGDVAPPAPAGLAAAGGLKQIGVSWTALAPAQKGLDFAFYRLFRSTDAVTSYVKLATTTATSYLDRPLPAGVTFFYRVGASEGPGGLDGPLSSTAAAAAFALPPQEPFGFRVSGTSSTVSLAWAPTVRYGDGEPFASTGTPAADELAGYRVLRSTDICSPSFAQVSTTPVSVTSFTDVATGGSAYFYQVRAFNSVSDSTGTLTMTGLGDHHLLLDDCETRIVLDQAQAYSLLKSSNGLGGDVMISRSRRPQDVSGDVVESVEFKPLLNGQTELKNFVLPSPARIRLHFLTSAGAPVGDTRPTAAAAASRPQSGGLSAGDSQNLGAFWFNGQEFKKLYGKIDPVSQTLTIETPNPGVYQVRRQLRAAGVVFDLSNISARAITPNGDGLNDVVIFTYDPGPNNVVPEGRVYDLRGGFVANMTAGAVPNTLTWDGMSNGRVVTSGVYVYQIKGDGKSFSGTIVVAR